MAYNANPLPGSQVSGILTAATQTVVTQPNSGDTAIEIEVFPTPNTTAYSGLTLYFEESIDSQVSWLPRAIVSLNTQNVIATNNGLGITNGETHGWQTTISSTGTTQFRVRCSAISAGSASINLRSFPSPNNPFAAAVNAGSSGGPGVFSTLTLTGLLTENSQNALTALSGGGQPGATAITANIARFTTVAAPADSGLLMASAAGLDVTVINSGANSMDVYPSSGDTINLQGANNPYVLAAGRLARFTCAVAGTWNVQPGTSPLVNTNITTAGAGTLTAAGMVGGVITRSGATGAYSDATDTAGNIIAAIPGAATGDSWYLTIKNTVAFAETITNGGSVTLSGQTIIPPNSAGSFLVTVTGATTVSMRGLFVSPLTTNVIEAQTALATNGAGTITAAAIAAGATLRTTVSSAATDTTDSVANIIAALPNANIGQSWEYTYSNNSGVIITLAGASNVTIPGITVGPGGWVRFLVTYVSASSITFVPLAAGANFGGGLPLTQLSTGTTTTTFTAGELTGAQDVTYTSTATTPGSIATRTATLMYGDIPGAYVGLTYRLRIINNSGSANSLTLTAGSGVTLSGKTTYVATQYGFMDFYVTFTSATAATMQWVGSGVGTTN